MTNDSSKGFGAPHGFHAPSGFPAAGFPSNSGFPSNAGLPQMGFPDSTGFPTQSVGFPAIGFPETENKPVEESSTLKKPKEFEGILKLSKTDTSHAWKEFGGDPLAVFETDGSAYITREIERESKKSGDYFKLTEKLTRDANGYGSISWNLTVGAITRRKAPKQKFDESWSPAILRKVREVVADGVPVAVAARALSEELGVSFSTIRANLWVADRWAKGESSTFLPHRSMVRPIFELLCELGKKESALSSMSVYCTEVSKPSESVIAVLNEYQ